MTSRNKNLEIRIQKYLNGELSDREISDFVKSFSEEGFKEQLDQSIEIDYLMAIQCTTIDSKRAYLDFLSQIKSKKIDIAHTPKKKPFAVLKYAAIFIGVIGLTYVLGIQNEYKKEFPSLIINEKAITLQLENGKIKTIHSNGKIQITDKKGHVLAIQQGNKITYKENLNSKKLVYNELNIPYGKTFQVRLSDGTEVFLNAGSSLKYPVAFLKGKNRQVFVKGEAYFKVTKDAKHPFVVTMDDIDISVLGTEFNVSFYKEDDCINTVLVTGKVQLHSTSAVSDSNNSLKLTPGHIASWNKAERNFTVANVDTEIYTRWMEGKLVFRDMPFKMIRKKLERHYNVSIVNHNKQLDQNTFSANFDIESIEDVLETFNRNFNIKYKIVDNQVVIY